MENKAPETIPYLVHESHVARLERTIKRLWILCIIIFLALIGTNAYWIWYESQWEDQVVTQEIKQDSGEGGTVNYNGLMIGVGDGETDHKADSQDTEAQDGR